MKASELKIGQRIRVGGADVAVDSHWGGGWNIRIGDRVDYISFIFLDAIGFEVIEPVVIRAKVVIEFDSDYLIDGESTAFCVFLQHNNAQPGDVFDMVLTKREAAVAEANK